MFCCWCNFRAGEGSRRQLHHISGRGKRLDVREEITVFSCAFTGRAQDWETVCKFAIHASPPHEVELGKPSCSGLTCAKAVQEVCCRLEAGCTLAQPEPSDDRRAGRICSCACA
jgi:hypothetical protein